MAVEYKLPYELTGNDLVTGLVSEIQLERDVINRGDDNLVFPAKALAAAAITQLFPHLVRMGVQYGYICTGQAFVFLYIPDDPTSVRYHVCVPNLDIIEDNENRLHRTAFVQVLAFTLRALRVPLPPQSWNDTASRLGRWVVEFKDMLARFSNAAARRPPSASPQLAEDRGPDAGAMPLYRSEGYRSLFKFRLSAYGYTLLAKGVEAEAGFYGGKPFDLNTTSGQVLIRTLEEQRNHFAESELQSAVANLSELLGDEQAN
ncbi:hypothetical protein SAPIO_CDS0696 [Scedosporium apiospermum]|uniref:Uncharacterized protein n=1 Tax=Pseudallescheria apiosperma TaxID=563466 RepID=A0A084GGB9_PSEDA|nr:uncharacterized protein SAPIO_CDS0696 [Scedosporium apiospermum]KEZ46381.1 hypothetical protein SAPIO_CDS0696 [Scedosporium apiospermum]